LLDDRWVEAESSFGVDGDDRLDRDGFFGSGLEYGTAQGLYLIVGQNLLILPTFTLFSFQSPFPFHFYNFIRCSFDYSG
jgi:hypothetical protein